MTRKEFVEYNEYDKMLDNCIYYVEIALIIFLVVCYETGKLSF